MSFLPHHAHLCFTAFIFCRHPRPLAASGKQASGQSSIGKSSWRLRRPAEATGRTNECCHGARRARGQRRKFETFEFRKLICASDDSGSNVSSRNIYITFQAVSCILRSSQSNLSLNEPPIACSYLRCWRRSRTRRNHEGLSFGAYKKLPCYYDVVAGTTSKALSVIHKLL